jgi:dTMP kinase
VLANRYVSSNKGHQAGKIKNKKKLDNFLNWLDNLEYNIFAIPKPDKTFLLYLPYQIGQKFVDKKGYRDYIGGKKRDIHEKDSKHLKDAQKAYLYVAKKEKWDIIDCMDQATKEPKPIDVINDILYQKIIGYFI